MAHRVSGRRRTRWRSTWMIGLVAIATNGLACVSVSQPHLHDPAKAASLAAANTRDAHVLKVHLASGDLAVFSSWRLTRNGELIEGKGERYDATRTPRASGPLSVPVADVALLETNDSRHVGVLAQVGLSTLTTFWGAVSVVCAIDPKSCFGSCPTFYTEDEPDRPRAEGFSSSIAKALEARDLDAIGDVRPRHGRLTLVMKNEALETHAVRRLRLVAVERPPGSRVFATPDGRFRPVTGLTPATQCRGPEGDCAPALSRPDDDERRSATDALDLATREVLELSFPRRPRSGGLVIRARQSLLTTFLFYQTLGYLGRDAGAYLAAIERGGADGATRVMGMARLLGGMDVEVEEANGLWRSVGAFDEAGPIASDTQILPLPHAERGQPGPLRVRLRMAKGHYRIDWIALGDMGAELRADVIDPDAVEKDGRPDPRARALLREGRGHLVTLPGDQYRLSFPLPRGGKDSELFLESEGYYYEWMREEWLGEQDQAMALLIATRPDEALRRLAGPFKAREAAADVAFWNSRYEGRRP